MTDYLFVFPVCEHCRAVKDYLASKNIPYEERNIGIGAGKQEWYGKIYPQVRGQIKKDPKYENDPKNNNIPLMPILVRMNDSKIEKLVQGEEDIKNLFEGK